MCRLPQHNYDDGSYPVPLVVDERDVAVVKVGNLNSAVAEVDHERLLESSNRPSALRSQGEVMPGSHADPHTLGRTSQ